MVNQQLSRRFLKALSHGASATKSGSLFHVQPLELQKWLAFVRAGIRAEGPSIDGGSQLVHRNTLPEAGSGYRGINSRPWSTLPEDCGAAWTEAEALTGSLLVVKCIA